MQSSFIGGIFKWFKNLTIGCFSTFVILAVIGLLLPSGEKGKSGGEEEKPKAAQGQTDGDAPYDAAAELKRALADLEGLVGLEGVKAEVHKMVNKEKVDAARRAQGLPVAPRSLHMVFTGNPGRG
ncbi:MAG: hypothetical protein IKJ89_09550 [Kiritimatiellae bacterium]|nr:hypothetical protein [Kiritimatiellia bacterium]